jgi:suppressor of ftsI/bilirubin oxidase
VPAGTRSDESIRLGRRRLVSGVGAGALGALLPTPLAVVASPTAGGADDVCANPGAFDTPLHVPGAAGLMGRLVAGNDPLTLRATARGSDAPQLGFAARSGGVDYLNPTLVLRRDDRVRLSVANDLAEPTVAHWHGFTMDTANDGNGETVVAPGAAFDYAFTVRNRAGLYWYHPHPHGLTAGQAARGLVGLVTVEDDEEAALRRALELVPGTNEIPLLLHDRRGTGVYEPTAEDTLLGWFGDAMLVNFTPRPYLDATAGRYRFRILNASNARTYRLGFRRDNGTPVPFFLLGTDGGLLERAQRCTDVFVSPAERIDVLVDFTGIPVGGFVLAESRAFDPMQDVPRPVRAPVGAEEGDAHGHAAGPAGIPDGAPLALLQIRIRRRADASPPVPDRLSAPVAAAALPDDDRPLRLGFAKGRWRINDRVYERGATPIVVARGGVETWLLRNYHTSTPHAMHLHGFQFRVVERQTSPAQLAPLAVDARGRLATDLGWKDTVLVWPGESVRIAIDFRHPFDGEQIYLVHCHNLEHEDGGMMLRVRVA